MLENLARQLEREQPGAAAAAAAAAAVREGLEKTLTAKRPGLSGSLDLTFSTTAGKRNLANVLDD